MNDKNFKDSIRENSFNDPVVASYVEKIARLLRNSGLSSMTILKITIGVSTVMREDREQEDFKRHFRKV